MARVRNVVLLCLSGLCAPLTLAACEAARDAQNTRRAETPILAARRAAPAPAPTPQPETSLPPPAADTTPDREASAPGAARALVRSLAPQREAWQARLRTIPELARYASHFVPFNDKAIDEALSRGQRSRSSVTAWSIADGPFAWSPDHASEYFVTSGNIGERALIAVLEVQASGALRHAASLVIDDKDASVALGSSAEHPNELVWSTCYGCPGEGGSILLGEDGRPRFVYR